eukprot:NODE_782_length_3919_cov_0.611518.p3 type:complete len:264 gc:universal NODE_782_length_3919_cov_0.611518:1558-2349(+)
MGLFWILLHAVNLRSAAKVSAALLICARSTSRALSTSNSQQQNPIQSFHKHKKRALPWKLCVKYGGAAAAAVVGIYCGRTFFRHFTGGSPSISPPSTEPIYNKWQSAIKEDNMNNFKDALKSQNFDHDSLINLFRFIAQNGKMEYITAAKLILGLTDPFLSSIFDSLEKQHPVSAYLLQSDRPESIDWSAINDGNFLFVTQVILNGSEYELEYLLQHFKKAAPITHQDLINLNEQIELETDELRKKELQSKYCILEKFLIDNK